MNANTPQADFKAGDRVLVEAVVVAVGPTLIECTTPQGSDFYERESVHPPTQLKVKRPNHNVCKHGFWPIFCSICKWRWL